jgi:hypothetical protein
VSGRVHCCHVSLPPPPLTPCARTNSGFLGSFFFAFTPFVSLALVRHRRKERRFGPSPANDYTEGYGGRKKFGWFGLGRKRAAADAGQDPNTLPEHTTPGDLRTSYATEQTRVGSSGGYGGLGHGPSKYESPYANAGDSMPMGNYPNQPTENTGNRYDNNGGMYR